MNDNESRQDQRMSFGMKVIIGLAILTAIEYFVAVGLTTGANALLAIIAIVKAWLILDYFMHLRRVWKSSDDH